MFTNDRGFTLVEMLFCVAIVGFLVLAVASLEHSAFNAEKRSEFQGFRQPVLSVIRSLRSDFQRSEKLELVENSRVILNSSGHRVEWISSGSSIVRLQGAMRQRWRLGCVMSFRESSPGTIEVFFPELSMYSYYSIQGGIR